MLVLAICCLSLFIFGVDSTIVNVALPSIQHDLHAPVSGLQWTVDAYTVVIASVLILAGSTADRFGRRKVFQIGLAIFTLGSLLCSLAPGLGWLVTFRMLQAVGGSMMNPVAVSIIANTFTDPRERARAIGIWGGVFGLSIAAGPPLGGVLVDSVGWRGIFWVNIPVGVAAIVLTALFVPESRAGRPRRVDPVGQVLVIVTLASLTYAIIEGPRAGWTSPVIVSLFAVAAAAAAGLVAYEPRRREPLLDIRFFRSAPFTGATLIAVSALAALGGFLFLNTLYLQDVRGLSALSAGLYTLPLAVMTLLLAPLSGWIIGRWGPRLPLVVAGVAMTAGGLLLTSLAPGTSVGRLHGGLRDLRDRDRHGERADHQHRRVRHAPLPGGRGGGHRLDQPPGRPVAGRRGGRGGRDIGHARPAACELRPGQPRRLVDHRRVRRSRSGPKRGHDRAVGAANRGANRREHHIGGAQAPRRSALSPPVPASRVSRWPSGACPSARRRRPGRR